MPLYALAVGLMIYFSIPDKGNGYTIMCQVIIVFSSSTLILCQQVAVHSVAEHKDTASVLALLGLFGYIRGAIGNSISGALRTINLITEAAAAPACSCQIIMGKRSMATSRSSSAMPW